MNWAPCLAASWARSSCFWIIDSLSPVQLAWTSAPRTVRDIGLPSSGWGWVRGREGTPRRRLWGVRAVAGPRVSRRRRLVRGGVGTTAHVPLGELAAATLGIEPAHEEVRELPIDLAPVVGEVAGPAVGDEDVAVDGENVVVGLPGAGLVGVLQPRGDERRPPDERLVERVVGVPDIRAEQVADGDRIVESPGVDIALEPVAESGAVHGCLRGRAWWANGSTGGSGRRRMCCNPVSRPWVREEDPWVSARLPGR